MFQMFEKIRQIENTINKPRKISIVACVWILPFQNPMNHFLMSIPFCFLSKYQLFGHDGCWEPFFSFAWSKNCKIFNYFISGHVLFIMSDREEK